MAQSSQVPKLVVLACSDDASVDSRSSAGRPGRVAALPPSGATPPRRALLAALSLAGALNAVHFVGHSVSSMIGALAYLDDPNRFKTITMIGPSPCYINDKDYVGGFEREDIEGLLETLESNHVAWSANMAPAIMENPESPELAAELEASFCRMDPHLASHFARVTFLSDNRADLPRIAAKTLVLQCRKDVIAGLQRGRIRPQVSATAIRSMDATGHCPHMSAPKEVIQELQRFLA